MYVLGRQFCFFFFEKSFAKYPFNSEKNFNVRQVFTKAFRFRYIHLLKKAVVVLAFSISAGSNSM